MLRLAIIAFFAFTGPVFSQVNVNLSPRAAYSARLPEAVVPFSFIRQFRLGQTLDQVRSILSQSYADHEIRYNNLSLQSNITMSGVNMTVRTSEFPHAVRIVKVSPQKTFADIMDINFTSPASGSVVYSIKFRHFHENPGTAPLYVDMERSITQRYDLKLARLGHASTRTAYYGFGTTGNRMECSPFNSVNNKYAFNRDFEILNGQLRSHNSSAPVCEYYFHAHVILSGDRAVDSTIDVFSPRILMEGLTADWAQIEPVAQQQVERHRDSNRPGQAPRL